MNVLVRLGKFNAVGAMGMVVQLGALALLGRAMPGHLLVASALAVELALLHNFCWHLRFTWSDRRAEGAWWAKLLRFHAGNGMVSLVGNVVLMRVLLGAAVPLLAANAVAIASTGLVNFTMAHLWTFAQRRKTAEWAV